MLASPFGSREQQIPILWSIIYVAIFYLSYLFLSFMLGWHYLTESKWTKLCAPMALHLSITTLILITPQTVDDLI